MDYFTNKTKYKIKQQQQKKKMLKLKRREKPNNNNNNIDEEEWLCIHIKMARGKSDNMHNRNGLTERANAIITQFLFRFFFGYFGSNWKWDAFSLHWKFGKWLTLNEM